MSQQVMKVQHWVGRTCSSFLSSCVWVTVDPIERRKWYSGFAKKGWSFKVFVSNRWILVGMDLLELKLYDSSGHCVVCLWCYPLYSVLTASDDYNAYCPVSRATFHFFTYWTSVQGGVFVMRVELEGASLSKLDRNILELHKISNVA